MNVKASVILLAGFCTASNFYQTSQNKGNLIENTDRARKMLTDHLKEFNSEDVSWVNVEDGQDFDILNLPGPLVVGICSFLDYDSLKVFGWASKKAQKARYYTILHRLRDFHKSYVFEERWFNEIFYSIIIEHFPWSIQLEDDLSVYDHVELMSLKYILEDYNARKIPKYIYGAVISFIYGTLYGLESCVPVDLEDWMYSFGVKCQKHDLPLSKSHYFEETASDYAQLSNAKGPLFALNFLSQKPSIEAQKDFVALHGGKMRVFGKAIEMLFLDNFSCEEISENDAKLIITKMTFHFYPENILKNIKMTESLFWWAERSFKNYPNAWFMRLIFRNSGTPVTNSLTYLWSCDLENPFDLEEARQFSDFNANEMILEVLKAKMPFLVQLDILAKIVRSGILGLENGCDEKLMHVMTCSSVFDLILLESPKLVNFSSFDVNFENKLQFDLFFGTQFIENNPLALIFVLGSNLKHFTPKIIGRFNLNVKYTFDKDFSSVACGTFSSRLLRSLVGKTLTFKEIVRVLEDKSVYSAFGLNKNADRKDHGSTDHFPIYLLSDYFKDPNTIV